MKFERFFQAVKNGNDVRGVVLETEKEARTFSPELAAYIARAFTDFLACKLGKESSELRIAVGHDSRITAGDMKKECFHGLSVSEVFDCGMITTPAMFQSTLLPESHFDGAIMLTASHLPFNRNGMKFFTENGALSSTELKEILQIAAELSERWGEADADCLVTAARLPIGAFTAQTFDMKAIYAAHMKQIICAEVQAEDFLHPLSGLHIVVDAGNGASGFFATEILKPLGADISGSVYLEPDGHFPNHVPNPEDGEAMRAAREMVLSAGADLGVIFDCDGDRAAVVFEDGTEVNRNTLIALLAVIVAENHPGSWIVTDSVTSDELADFLTNGLGLKHLRFKRGYKNVIDRGIELNRSGECCELAIETSGHGAFRENHFSDDGAYIAVKIICRMARLLRENKKISSLIAGLGQPAESAELRFKIKAEDFKVYGENVLNAFRNFAERDVRFHIVKPNYEGIRIAFQDEEVQGWLLLRMSLHDPVMPMNIEAESAGGVAVIRERIRPFFSKYTELELK